MDPQQRLLLECSLEALMPVSSMYEEVVGRLAGSFVGISMVEYALLLRLFGYPLTAYTATGGHLAVAAGRLSYTFGFRGPALSIDTACSASLVAAHLGRESISLGRSSSALVSGVNLMLHPHWTNACNQAGMLSLDG
eukprot:scaffold3494_cov878-Pavlova_lutheri.AAC.1